MYLKGNVPALKIVDWAGNPLASSQLDQGQYKFGIKANLLYFGNHVDEKCMVSIQLRISQIAFRPLESILDDEKTAVQVTNSLDQSSNSPAAKRAKTTPLAPKKSRRPPYKRQNGMVSPSLLKQ